MNDLELLKLAAKAMNVPEKDLHERWDCWEDSPILIGRAWNPLTTPSDTMLTVIKLKIEFYIADDEGLASYAGYATETGVKYCVEYHDDLLYGTKKDGDVLATCRAITRAAAEIGKGLK